MPVPLVRYSEEEVDSLLCTLNADPSLAHLSELLLADPNTFTPAEEVPYMPVASADFGTYGPEKRSHLGHGFPSKFPAPWLTPEGGCFSQKPPKECAPSTSAWAVTPQNKMSGFTSDYHLEYLREYLKLNGNRSFLSIPGDGDCMYSSVRRQLQAPAQYTNIFLRRQLAIFMLEHHSEVFPAVKKELTQLYGYRGGDVGPFSYLKFAKEVSTLGVWGDQVVLKVLSMMWGIRITVVLLPNITEIRVRHDLPLKKTDVVLILSGQHYSAAGKLSALN